MNKVSQFVLYVVVVFFCNVPIAHSSNVVWGFAKVEPNPFSVGKSQDLSYSVKMSIEGSDGWVYTLSYSVSELKPLLPYFKVNSPEELTGKTFKSTEGDASSAIDLLKIQLLHKTNYTPPTAEELYDRAARALANMQLPDFSDVDQETVFRAYEEAFTEFDAKPEWQDSFSAKIHRYSGGKVQLTKADREQFSAQVNGPADYLLLVSKSGEKKRVIIGPSPTPILFD